MVIFESTRAGGAGAIFGDFEAEVGEGEAAAPVNDSNPWPLDDIGAELESPVFVGLELALEGIGTAFDGTGMGPAGPGAIFEEDDTFPPEDLEEPEFWCAWTVGVVFCCVWLVLGLAKVEKVAGWGDDDFVVDGFESTLVGGFGAVFVSVLTGCLVSVVKNELPKDLGLQPDVNDDRYPVPLLSARFPVLFVAVKGKIG